MRADLHMMEQIDLYLQGKMSVAESTAFQAKMAADPSLANRVAEQQLFAQSVSRKAILAEINLVAAAGVGGSSWYTNPYVLGGAGATVVGGIIAAAVYYNSTNNEVEPSEEITATEQSIENNQLQPDQQIITASGDTIQYNEAIAEMREDDERSSTTDHVEDDRQDDLVHYDEEGSTSTPGDDPVQSDGGSDNSGAVTPSVKSINKKAGFPGCSPDDVAARTNYIKENVIYPGTAKKEQLQATVKVQFNVDKEGQRSEIRATCLAMFDENENKLSPTQFQLKKSVAKLFEDKAISTIRTMPAWEPATDSQGNPVVAPVTLYFKFSLPDKIIVYEIPE